METKEHKKEEWNTAGKEREIEMIDRYLDRLIQHI